MTSSKYTRLPVEDSGSYSPPSSSFSQSETQMGDNAILDSEEPLDLPPAYEPPSFIEFEIENENTDENMGFRAKAGKFMESFNSRVVRPISKTLDPVYQLYCYANARFEYMISKMGNPLIAKRMIYIVFVSIILYTVSLSGLSSDGVVGSHSDFSDQSKLLEFIELSVDPRRLEENLEYLSSMPHLSGTSGDMALARYFEELVLRSKLEINPDVAFDTYTNYPLEPKVLLFSGNGDEVLVECDLVETLEDHLESSIHKLAFNPGSKDMNSRGKLIYANYGTLQDYKILQERSIAINGSVLIIKYGGMYPAYKKLEYAQERGAIGVLFISDPQMKEYYNLESLQREPVAFTNKMPGNMLSPGIHSGSPVEHVGDLNSRLQEARVVPSIPSLPIKWKDFITIMDKLSNQGARIEGWDIEIEGKPIQIWTGGDDEVLLQNSLIQRPYKESWNIIGKLKGMEQDTFSIVIGASRDTMCYGAVESSGSAILLELMNIFSAMSSSLSWSPLRTIYFVSYGGSKYNLAGSTHFAMKNQDLFKRDVYTFIDLDDIIQGDNLEIIADPLFLNLVKDAIDKMAEANSTTPHFNYNSLEVFPYQLNSLSNLYPNVEHHNVAGISMKLKNSGNLKNQNTVQKFNIPQYSKNSCLDTFDNFRNRRIDPDMSKHAFMTKLIALVAVKLVETPILPYDLRAMWNNMKTNYLNVKEYSKSRGYDLSFDSIDKALNEILEIAQQNEAFVNTWNDICDDGHGSEPNLLTVNRWDWNAKLLLMTKVMIYMDGSYEHPFNYNLIYGLEEEPELRYFNDGEGFDDSIEMKNMFPGIWDAINKGAWDEAQFQINKVGEALNHCIKLFQY